MKVNKSQIARELEYLKMKQMIIHLDEVIDFITRNNFSFVERLIKLTSYEIDYKENKYDSLNDKSRSISTSQRIKKV